MDIAQNLSMAMGTEQQVIHPFFRQEFGVTAKPTSSNDSSSAASSNPNDHLRINNEGSNLELEPHVLNPCDSNTSNINDEGAVALDEDPNESRRKRRRTDKTQTTEPTTAARAGLSAWLGVSAPAPLNPLTDVANDPDTTLSTFQLGTPPAETPAEDATKVSTLTKKEPQSRAARSSARQKILKLNSNGKFLSSPASSPPPETEKNGTGKRRRARKEETKVVIFKYGLGKEGKIGTLINDILNGLTRTTPWKSAIQPRKKKSQSRKPTHPFFNKTSMHNTGTPNSIDGQPDSPKAPTQTTAGTPVKKRVVPASDISFSKIPRRVSKFPELVHPTWPPKDLVHVRDTNPPLLGINGRAWYKSQDKKKSKIAAISIRDEENVLLTGTAEARKIARLSTIEAQDIPAILRHPVRHVASSHVLQAAMERQMSWSSPNRQFHWTATTPPLAKLRLALLSSVSAIDRGKYESHLWPHKYAPTSANEVLQLGREPQMLRDWLRHLKITAVDTGSSSKENVKSKLKEEKKRKKRQKRDKLDGFVVSSEEEVSEMDNISGSDDELAGNVTTLSQKTVVRSGDMVSGSNGTVNGQLSNAILISGPPGCGKTASVYAVAKELDFEVFEINAGSRRTARDMLERVGDMTQNHLVHLLNETDSAIDSNKADVKPNNLMGFFKGPSTKVSKSADTTSQSENETKRPREQKQCLILLEEADILFEEDRQFWTGVLTLISQSKRPIIITCNDESLIPTREMSLHAILRYQKPSPDFVIDYLLLVAANEGHILKREAVTRLYQGSGLDLRKSLMDLNFWCQMGVGSDKSGLDWLLPAWPPESNVDQNGDRLRVLSLNTYERYMGWFNRDLLSTHSSLDGETEVIRNSFHNWGVGLQDSEDMAGRSEVELLSPHSVQSSSKVDQLDMICREADYYDMRSSLDMLCSNFSTEMKKDVVDISAPPMPEGQRSNYLDNYPLLETPLRAEYSSLSEIISSTFTAMVNRTFHPTAGVDIETLYANRVLSKTILSAIPLQTPPLSLPQFQRIFEPIMRANYSIPTPTARHAPSFENGLAPITEDLAPYIRAIMSFDGRLYQYRQRLFALTAQEPGTGEKRSRNTRASRAALEGGDKASVRRERWFTSDVPYYKVQGTAGADWQELLFQMGYFHVEPTIEPSPEKTDHVSGDLAMVNA